MTPTPHPHKLLARAVLRIVAKIEGGADLPVIGLRARCIKDGYVWGDMFLQTVALVRRFEREGQSGLASLARASELRADLRGFVSHDARPDSDDLILPTKAGVRRP